MVEFWFQGRIRVALVEGFRVVCISIIEIKIVFSEAPPLSLEGAGAQSTKTFYNFEIYYPNQFLMGFVMNYSWNGLDKNVAFYIDIFERTG